VKSAGRILSLMARHCADVQGLVEKVNKVEMVFPWQGR